MECAQPSVNLLLNRLESSKRRHGDEAQWAAPPKPSGQEPPCTLQPRKHPPSPSLATAAPRGHGPECGWGHRAQSMFPARPDIR